MDSVWIISMHLNHVTGPWQQHYSDTHDMEQIRTWFMSAGLQKMTMRTCFNNSIISETFLCLHRDARRFLNKQPENHLHDRIDMSDVFSRGSGWSLHQNVKEPLPLRFPNCVCEWYSLSGHTWCISYNSDLSMVPRFGKEPGWFHPDYGLYVVTNVIICSNL